MTERTPIYIVIYRHLSEISNRIVGKFTMHHLISRTISLLIGGLGFTNIVVWSTGQSGAETNYGVPTVPGQ